MAMLEVKQKPLVPPGAHFGSAAGAAPHPSRQWHAATLLSRAPGFSPERRTMRQPVKTWDGRIFAFVASLDELLNILKEHHPILCQECTERKLRISNERKAANLPLNDAEYALWIAAQERG